MKPEIKRLRSNDTSDWTAWQPRDPLHVCHWLSLDIGPVGEEGAETFQATRRTVADRPNKASAFRGFVVDSFDKRKVKELLREYIVSNAGQTWDEVSQQLCKKMMGERE